MPLFISSDLHAIKRLQGEGVAIHSASEQSGFEGRTLHMGFLNMMPDAALHATERQFFRLLAKGSEHFSVIVHPFTIEGLNRRGEIREYIDQYYRTVDEAKSINFDALVLTGANPRYSNFADEPYWNAYVEVLHWANTNVRSILCSCLATHAVVEEFHGIARKKCLPDKRWGVFTHRKTCDNHPLLEGIQNPFQTPHSHVYEMTGDQLNGTGIRILASSEEADFHIATSGDGLHWIFFQGHPEYDKVSLLKEYKREISLYLANERDTYPEYPKYYLDTTAEALLDSYRKALFQAIEKNSTPPPFPESEVLPLLNDSWHTDGVVIFRNWIRAVANA